MALSTTNLTAKQREQVLNYIAATAASKTMTAQQLLECSADQKQALIKAGLITAEEAETGTTIALNNEKIKEILLDETLTVEDKKLILGAFGVTGANLTEASSWEVLAKSIGKATVKMLAWLFTTPAGWATLAISAIVGATIAYNKWGDTLENTREKLVDLKSECDSISSDLESANGELKTTQDRISELEGKGKLSFTEAEELENLRKQNNELQRTVDLLELEHKAKTREKNKTFVSTMEKDTGDPFEYEVNPDGKNAGQYGIDDNYLTSETKYIEYQFEQRSKLLNDLSNAKSKEDKERIQKSIDEIDKFLREQNDEYIEDSDGIDYIQNPTNDDDKKVNEWLDYIHDFQDKMAIAMGGDNAKENAFNRIVDNWKFDELLNPLQKLGKEGKVTAEMLNDPKYDEFIQNLIDIGFISDDTEGSLRYVANAFNGTAQAAQNYVTSLKGNDINNFIKNLNNEAKALGTTESELAKLTAAHVIFNNTGLSTEQQQQALQMLAAKIATTSAEMKYLLQLFNYASGNFDAAGTSTMTEQERRARSVRSKQYLKDKYGIDLSPIKIPEKEDVTPYTPSGGDDKGSSKDNTPDYEDPTDAIINRINLRSKELEQQEESIQNLIEIAELENDYKKQISLTNDLIAKRKDRLTELETANALLHNEAEFQRNIHTFYNEDRTESDENLWFDSQGNATEYYNALLNKTDITKEEQEAIKDLFEKLSKYKDAYKDNAEEIADINKEILQDEEKIWDLRREEFDDRLEESEYYIQHSKDFGWENGDNEIKARKRVLDWIQSDYYKSLIKDDEEYYKILEEHRLNYIEAQKDQFNNATDFGSSYFDSHKTLLQSYFDVTNSIAEAQHEINKELETSKTMYEWLDKDTQILLFNQEDYNTLSEELYDIQYKADKLRRQYERDLQNSTLDTIEQITSNYEMQYEMLMKSYEIAKADLEVAKKKQKLNNVLNERNVRMFINGQWQWVANTQDVIDAQSELADAEYARKTAEAGERQTKSLNNLTSQQDELGTIINMFESGVIDLDTAVGKVTQMFGSLPSAIQNALSSINRSSYSSSSNGTTYSYNGISYDPSFDYSAAMKNVPVGSDAWNRMNQKRNAKILGEGLDYKPFATGTRYTPAGNLLLGEEEPETFINANGHLIPINQPTLGDFGAGGIVFNQEQMSNLRSLWDLSNMSFNHPLPTVSERGQTTNTVDNRIIINGMTVDSGSSDGQALINALRRYVGNH